MDTQDIDVAPWLLRVKAEYNDLPGMHLTKPQIQRLFGLDRATCDALLNALEEVDFLRCIDGQEFVRADLER
jgi:hypothetical protein